MPKLPLKVRLRRLWCAWWDHRWRTTVIQRRMQGLDIVWDYRERTCNTCGRVEYWSAATKAWRWGGKFTKDKS